MRLRICYAILIAASLGCFVPAPSALGGGNPQHKIAVHIMPHGAGCGGVPVFTACSQIATAYPGTGDIDVVPVFYDLDEFSVVEFGLTWPAAWGSMEYALCAGDLCVGGIAHPGDGIATAWITCQNAWSVAHGCGWVFATGPGVISAVPNPPTGDYGVVDCSPRPGPYYDYPAATAAAGVGGASGDDPCVQVFMPLTLTKTDGLGGGCASQGDTIIYTLAYSNAANLADVHDVIIEDQLPAAFTFISASAGGAYDGPANRVEWTLGTLAPRQEGSVEVTGRVDAAPEATLANSATIVGTETGASQTTSSTQVCSLRYVPLGLAKNDGLDGACVFKGLQLTYAISFDNCANAGLVHGVVLADHLPPSTTFISASDGGVYDGASRTVTWNIGTLEPGARDLRTLTLAINAPRGSTVRNTCDISGDEVPPAEASRHTDVCSAATALSLVKDDGLDGQCAFRGDTITYTLSYRNTLSGTEIAGAVLSDRLSEWTQFVSASAGGDYDVVNRSVIWTIGDLAPLETGSREVRAEVTGPPGSVINNSAQISGLLVPTTYASKVTLVRGIYLPPQPPGTWAWSKAPRRRSPIAAKAGVCGEIGDAPCGTMRTQPTTWGAIKAMFR